MLETPSGSSVREVIVRMQSGKQIEPSIDCAARMGQCVPTRCGAVATLILVCWLLAACGAPAPVRTLATPESPAPLPPALAGSIADNPLALVIAERNAAATRDMAMLATLWDADAQIVEARGAPGLADDYTWQGREAVLDRYAVAVFPIPPPPLQETPDLHATLTGDSATLQNGVDTWRFARHSGRWWIQELVINGE